MMEEEKPVKKDNKNKKEKEEVEQLSEEDQALKDNIERLLTEITTFKEEQAKGALEQLKNIVKTATTSMTSVPKPFKFIQPHYENLVKFYESLKVTHFRRQLADFLSVLSMTMSPENSKLSLIFLIEGTKRDFISWGHGYLQHLSADVAQKYRELTENDDTQIEEDAIGEDELIDLVEQIVKYFTEHNAEHDAVDLLLEVDQLEKIKGYISETNTSRFLQYLSYTALYSVDQEQMHKTLEISYEIALERGQYSQALKFAMKLDDLEKVKTVFEQCQDEVVKYQLSFQVARQRIVIPDLEEKYKEIASNSKLTEYYLRLAKELDVNQAKHPYSINEGYPRGGILGHTENNTQVVAQGMSNLADTFVNAFVNVALKKDAFIIKDKEDSNNNLWINQLNSQHKVTGAASIGLIDLWDIDVGIEHITPYLEHRDDYVRMGAHIGVGIYNIGIQSDFDAAKGILGEQLWSDKHHNRLGSIIGLGYAYAGSSREEFLDEMIPLIIDGDVLNEVSAYTSLSVGLIFVGTANDAVEEAILSTISEKAPDQLDSTISRFFAVGLGLLYLGKQEKSEAIIKKLWDLPHPIGKYAAITVEGCAYMGSGNMLIIQKMLNLLKDPVTAQMKKFPYQEVAVIAIALIASSEDIGSEMVMRTMNHMLQYCEEAVIRRAVPLAMAILNISNPKLNIIASLMKLANDADQELALRSIIALGLIGAGTNNSRLGDCLKQLAAHFYQKKESQQFLTRVAQGMLYMGQGLISLQPYYNDRFLLSKVGIAGILTFIHSALDTQHILLDKVNNHHFFYLALAMYPKMLFLVDEKLEDQKLSVRVGQAVDTTGQTGKPKKIQGFRTHTSPVLLNHGERAEIGNEEFIPVQDGALENVIIIKKNPDYVAEEEKKPRKVSLSEK